MNICSTAGGRCFSIAATVGLMTGCTIVRVEGAAPSTSVYLGTLKIEPQPGAGLMILRTQGFGLVPSAHGMTFGYRREVAAWVYDPARCQVILFDRSPAEVADAEALRLLREIPSVCDVGGDKNEKPSN